MTSPPYFGLRDYGIEGQIGLECTPEEYVFKLVFAFREVWRVLREDGTIWVNLGDSYANDGKWGGRTGGYHRKALHGAPIGRNKQCTGLKPKDLMGIPWMVAFALRDDGWYLRRDIIWHKPNPMPESVIDRPTTAHEYIFLLSKGAHYHYDSAAIKEVAGGWNGSRFEDGKNAVIHPDVGRKRKAAGATEGCCEYRNKRTVWTVPSAPYSDAHFATYPPALIKPCILASAPAGGTVLDPFAGSGTTGMVALELGRSAVLVELKPAYAKLCAERCAITPGLKLD